MKAYMYARLIGWFSDFQTAFSLCIKYDVENYVDITDSEELQAYISLRTLKINKIDAWPMKTNLVCQLRADTFIGKWWTCGRPNFHEMAKAVITNMFNIQSAHYVVFFSGNVPQFGLCEKISSADFMEAVQTIWLRITARGKRQTVAK